jgi:PAS domain S-box-containing protein
MKNQIEEFSRQTKKSSDLLMNYFLGSYFIIGLLLAFYYDTWVIALGVGGLSLLAYYSSKFFFRDSNLYQYVLSIVTGIFMAQFIYEMHGMFEMHFFAFIGSAILITYRNWKLQIPLAIVVITHHAVFAYLQFIDFDKIYFTQFDYMTLQAFVVHCLLALIIFSLCGLWAYRFKRSEEKHVLQSFEIGKLQEANQQKEALITMAEDLKISNEKLKNSNSELEKIFNTVEEVLFSMDAISWRIIHISVACKRVYGYTPDEIIADSELWMKVIHPDDKHITQTYFKGLKEGRIVSCQYRIIHKNKSIRWIEAKLIPTLNETGFVVRIDGLCNDITDKIKLEKKLAEEKRQKQQQITAAVITAQENERSFLGAELHDNINPILATAKLFLDCSISAKDRRINLIKDSQGFISKAIHELRTLSKSLIPPSLGIISLQDAVTDMIGNIQQVNELRFITKWKDIDENQLSDKLKLTIFRIVQEQLNNILKHADAKIVYVGLVQENSVLELTIRDDGKGFDISQKRNGVGLQNIKSRTELSHGKAVINAAPGKGCELIVQFRIQQEVNSLQKTLRA